MAEVRNYQTTSGSGFDATDWLFSIGDVQQTILQPTLMLFDFGGGKSVGYLGSGIEQFNGYVTAGVVNVIEYRIDGELVSRTTGLNLSAEQLRIFYLIGDGPGALEYHNQGGDTFTGSHADETLFGYAGDDDMSGGAGNDILAGGSGANTLRGESGDDILQLTGTDVATGGVGSDTFEFLAGSLPASATITDFTEDDDIIVRDHAFTVSNVTVNVGAGSTTLTIDADQNGSGDFSIQLLGDFADTDFAVVNDGTHTTLAIQTGEIIPPPPPPVDASNDVFSVTESEGAGDTDGNVLSNDDDNGAGVVEVNGVAGSVGQFINLAQGGRVRIDANGALDFDADGDFEHLNDGQSAAVTVNYSIDDGFTSDTATVTINVQGETDAPPPPPPVNARNEAFSVTESEGAGDTDRNVLSNDDDNGAGVVEVNGVAGSVGQFINLAQGGRVRIDANGALDFDADGDFEHLNDGQSAAVTVNYSIDDGFTSDTATVTINVQGETDAPPPPPPVNARNEAFSVTESEGAGDTDRNVLSNDDDNGAGVVEVNGVAGSVGQFINLAQGGRMRIDANGALDFDADGDFEHLNDGQSAAVTVNYSIDDGFTSDTATVTINVQGETDAPPPPPPVNARNEAFSVTESEGAGDVNVDVLANDDDNGSGVVRVNGVSGSVGQFINLAQGGRVRIDANGALDFDADGDFEYLNDGQSLSVVVNYSIDDGFTDDTATVQINVQGETDAPPPPPPPQEEDGFNLIFDSAGTVRDDLAGTEDADCFVMQNDDIRDLVRAYDVDADVIDVSIFAETINDLEIDNLTRKDGSISWISVKDKDGDGEFLIRFANGEPTDAGDLQADHFVFADGPIPEPVLPTNVVLDTDTGNVDDLRATEFADIFVMLDDDIRDLVRGLDVGVDKIDVSAFAADISDLEITDILRRDGSTSWISVADSDGGSEMLVRFDGDTEMDAANLTSDDFIFA